MNRSTWALVVVATFIGCGTDATEGGGGVLGDPTPNDAAAAPSDGGRVDVAVAPDAATTDAAATDAGAADVATTDAPSSDAAATDAASSDAAATDAGSTDAAADAGGARCGNGVVEPGEDCDDGNTLIDACAYGAASCTVCGDRCTLVGGLTSFCGDGFIDGSHGESCDDGNYLGSDGCSSACVVEASWHCRGAPSTCWQDGPSCTGLAATCGHGGNEDCCTSTVVRGGTFLRDNGLAGNVTATVSDFRLDTYEISVGRFRKFVEGYPANLPAPHAGKNPNNPDDPGWNPIWNGDAYVPADRAALETAVQCIAAVPPWQNWTLGNDALPMNCLTWYEAYAFCIWDGGRLPTEAEWNYAAAGGSEQRPYPWSKSPSDTTIDASYAVMAPYAAVFGVTGSTSPKGDGRWGQADLAGNEMEWVADWRGQYPPTCLDCAYLDYNVAHQLYAFRMTRGGGAGDSAYFQLTSSRWYWNVPTFRADVIGARCARNP